MIRVETVASFSLVPHFCVARNLCKGLYMVPNITHTAVNNEATTTEYIDITYFIQILHVSTCFNPIRVLYGKVTAV